MKGNNRGPHRRARFLGAGRHYGDVSTGTTVVSVFRNSNCSVHSLGTLAPSTLPGWNVHFRAAFKAWPAKYLLGPGVSSSASVTRPVGSTCTFTLTLSVPRMLS